MDKLSANLTQFGLPPLLAFTKGWIILLAADGRLVEWNPAFERVKAARPEASGLTDFLDAPSRVLCGDLLQEKASWQGRLEFLEGDTGEVCDCQLLALPGGDFLFFAEPVSRPKIEAIDSLVRLLRETERALNLKKIELDSVMAQVDEIAHTDTLTFLSNRRQVIGDLQREVAACERYGKPLTVLMVDIDHFKQVNDTYGHATGDQVLRAVANRLREGIRVSDNIGRYGGEEFVILLPETPLKPALRLANRLLKSVRTLEIEIGPQVLRLTVSVGIAQYEIGQETWEAVLNRADQALYESKHKGRDCCSVSKFEKVDAAPSV